MTCKLPEGASKEESIPTEKGKFAKCSMYVNISLDNSTSSCTDGYEYGGDTGPTIVSEVGLRIDLIPFIIDCFLSCICMPLIWVSDCMLAMCIIIFFFVCLQIFVLGRMYQTCDRKGPITTGLGLM